MDEYSYRETVPYPCGGSMGLCVALYVGMDGRRGVPPASRWSQPGTRYAGLLRSLGTLPISLRLNGRVVLIVSGGW